MADVPQFGVPREWIARGNPIIADLADRFADQFGVPRQLYYNLLWRENGTGGTGNEHLRPTTSSANAFGYTQFIPSTAERYGVLAGNSPAAIESQMRGGAQYVRDMAWNLGDAQWSGNPTPFDAPDWGRGIGGYIASPQRYDRWSLGESVPGFGTVSQAYVLNVLRDVPGFDLRELPERFQNLPGFERYLPGSSTLGIGSDANAPLGQFDPWASPAEIQYLMRSAPDVLGWADQETLDPTALSSAFKQDATGWYLDPNVFQTMPGSVTALQGAYLQDAGLLDPKWGFDLGSGTWQSSGGAGNWQLANTSNPDVIESGLFQQWLPKGYQAAGPEVWSDTPLQFWVPDWSTDLLPSGASPTSGQFDLFNPQGQFDVNMLNAPGAVSPELGGWLQQQGIVNPSKGYNPVNQVWQDAPPAPGWSLVNTANVDPVYQQQITQQMASLFPMEHFDNIFEGTGPSPWAGPPVQNWLPPPAQGSSYHYEPGTSFGSTIASGGGVNPGAQGLGYQGSPGITTYDPGIVGLGNAIDANAQYLINQGYAQAAAANAAQAYHNAQANAAAAASNQGVTFGVPLVNPTNPLGIWGLG